MDFIYNNSQASGREAERRLWERVMQQKRAGAEAYRNILSAGEAKGHTDTDGAAPETPPAQTAVAVKETDEGAFLKNAINGELSRAKLYAALSKNAPGRRVSNVFMRLSNAELEHAKRFSSLYFLKTGEFYFPYAAARPSGITALNDALRECYREESEDVLKYLQAAERTGDPVLAETFRQTAADELCHAKSIRELIEAIMI